MGKEAMDESTGAGHATAPLPEPPRATPELCQVIESLIESAAALPEGTLSDIHKLLMDGIFTSDGEVHLVHGGQPAETHGRFIEQQQWRGWRGCCHATRDGRERENNPCGRNIIRMMIIKA